MWCSTRFNIRSFVIPCLHWWLPGCVFEIDNSSFCRRHKLFISCQKTLKENWKKKKALDETKTELIIFRSPQKNLPQEPDIRINNYKLTLHSYVKYLGILINGVLFWNKQIESIYMKLAGWNGNGIHSKQRYFVPKDTCISVHYSLFYTHLWLFGLVLFLFWLWFPHCPSVFWTKTT